MPQPLQVPPGATRWLRVTITGTKGGTGALGAGFRDVLIPGVQVQSFLQPAPSPADLAALAEAFSFQQQLPSPALLAHAAA
jgi:hypothetical protein